MGGKALARAEKRPRPRKRVVGRIFNPFSSAGRHIPLVPQTRFQGVMTWSLWWNLAEVGSAQTGSRKLGELVDEAGKTPRP